MRVKVTTTIRGDLWQGLQIEAIKQVKDCNTILEDLIAAYLKRRGKGGGKQ